MQTNWTFETIKNLLDSKIGENEQLDYKAAEALSREEKKIIKVSIAISAMANANGGTIIYGIQEKDKNNATLVLDPVDSSEFNHEWLENVIDSSISPKIEGIKIIPISVPDLVNKKVYVVIVPKGKTAHQAKDLKYHQRRNFGTGALRDYEIKDIQNRSNKPIIEVEFAINESVLRAPKFLKSFLIASSYSLDIYIKNIGSIYAGYINAFILFPCKGFGDLNDKIPRVNGKSKVSLDNNVTDTISISLRPGENVTANGFNRLIPLLPSTKRKVRSYSIAKHFLENDDSVSWEVYADNAEPRYGEITINQIPIVSI